MSLLGESVPLEEQTGFLVLTELFVPPLSLGWWFSMRGQD
jgi:hypothetical protein